MTAINPLTVGIKVCKCLTAFGDEKETYHNLIDQNCALKAQAVFGENGGDNVPLSLCNEMRATYPPRWISLLHKLLSDLPDKPWGTPAYPIIISSSNFGVDQLFAYSKNNNSNYLKNSTPYKNVEWVSNEFKLGSACTIISHACVSSNIALIYGSKLLQRSHVEEVLVLSYDFLSPFVTGGFYSLKILNGDFPKPYSDCETGSIALGDGAAFAVLSRKKCDVNIDAQMSYNECFHMTRNNPDGSGFRNIGNLILPFLKDKKVWINGHGTGTLEAGKLESTLFNEVFSGAPLVSWKGSLGHTLGSCGLVELAIAIESIKNNQTPGTIGSQRPCFSDNVALSSFKNNSYNGVVLASNAFGGAHAIMLISYD